MIQRLFAFSPFPETERNQHIISAAKPAADVERDLTFHNLPKRLVKDERKIESIASELTDLAKQIVESTDELSKLKNAIHEVQTIVDGAQASIDERNRIDQQQEEERASTKARIQSLGEDIHTLQLKLNDVGSQHTQLSELQKAIAQLVTAHDGWTRGREEDLGRIDSLEVTLADVTGNVAQLVESLKRLEQRVESAEASFTKESGHTQVPRSRADSEARQLTSRPLEKGESAMPIGTHSDLTAAFKHSLEWLGLRKSTAEIFAEECTAAAVARQAIFLQGAYAARVARALVQTVGGSNTFCLSIPVGIQNGVDIRHTIEEAFALEGKWVGGLALEGINHTPLDITREIISDCVDPTVHGSDFIGGRTVVIATLSRGIASLPIEPEYLELGPVFDIDYLDWRTNVPTVDPPHASFLPEDVDHTIYEQVRSSNANVEEVVHLARALVHKKSPAIERNVVRAFHALHVIRSDQQSVTPLHSLFFGWLLPYWRALGLPKEAIDIEFDGGNVHGAPPDKRLTTMFEAEFSEQSQVRA